MPRRRETHQRSKHSMLIPKSQTNAWPRLCSYSDEDSLHITWLVGVKVATNPLPSPSLSQEASSRVIPATDRETEQLLEITYHYSLPTHQL
jgi:hypothetical protein